MTIDTALSIAETEQRFLRQTSQTQSGATSAIYQQAIHAFNAYLAAHSNLKPATTDTTSLTLPVFHDFLIYLQDRYTPETEHAYSRALLAYVQYCNSTQNSPAELLENLVSLTNQARRKKVKQEHTIPFETINAIRSFVETYPVPESQPEGKGQRDRLRVLRDKALIFTIIDTGLKPSEATNLRVANLADDASSLVYRQVPLPIAAATRAAIHQYLHERTVLDQQADNHAVLPLFARHDKRASNHVLAISRWTVGNIISDWVNLAHQNVPAEAITPSMLRHHFVVTTLAETNDVALTQQRARHKHSGTTKRYIKQNPSENS